VKDGQVILTAATVLDSAGHTPSLCIATGIHNEKAQAARQEAAWEFHAFADHPRHTSERGSTPFLLHLHLLHPLSAFPLQLLARRLQLTPHIRQPITLLHL